jgi:apolipoprotein N-acyltransferase
MPSMTRTQSPAGGRVVRIVGIVLTAVFGVTFLCFAWMTLSSRFGGGTGDPHGYVLIFGTFLALLAGLALAFVVPLIFRSGRRGTAYSVSLLAYVVIAAGLIAALLTA